MDDKFYLLEVNDVTCCMNNFTCYAKSITVTKDLIIKTFLECKFHKKEKYC